MPLTDAADLRVQHLVEFSSFSKTTGEFVEHNEALMDGKTSSEALKIVFQKYASDTETLLAAHIRGCLKCDAQPSPSFLPTSITDEYQYQHPLFGPLAKPHKFIPSSLRWENRVLPRFC